jgi:hypothetical protein
MRADRKTVRPAVFGVALWAVLAMLLSGCASYKIVEINSNPRTAAIYVNGEERGVTPQERVRISFSDRSQRVLIQIVKRGYTPAFQYWTFDEVPDKKIFHLEAD